MIEVNVGEEVLEEASHLTQGIFRDTWREFINSFFAAASSENARSPERVEKALKGAAALMAPEGSEKDAKTMRDALIKRYGDS